MTTVFCPIVPCRRRARNLETDYSAETEVEGEDGDDGWLATHTNTEGGTGDLCTLLREGDILFTALF